MLRTCVGFTVILFVAFLRAPCAFAAEIPENVARCAAVTDNLERLTCYDRVIPPRRDQSGGANPSSGKLPPPATTESSEDDFGLNDTVLKNRSNDGVPAKRSIERIAAHVTKIYETSQGETLIELDNGQVWRQTERRIGPIAEPGEEVTISRGALSSYFITPKSHISTRVKRYR